MFEENNLIENQKYSDLCGDEEDICIYDSEWSENIETQHTKTVKIHLSEESLSCFLATAEEESIYISGFLQIRGCFYKIAMLKKNIVEQKVS